MTRVALIAICGLTAADLPGQTDTTPAPGSTTAIKAVVPDESYAVDLETLSKRQREYAVQIQQRLQSLPTNLRLVAMIPNLENRYGSFADVDGDGDLDYVATEMVATKEEVRMHFREAKRWRRGASRSRGLNKRHPLLPQFIANAGRQRGAVVLPVGTAPYLYLLELGAGGDFIGKPKPLGQYLPRRLSRPAGVANNPYVIESVESATKTTPARIHGRMTDENARQRQDVRFTLTLQRDGTVLSEVKQVAPGPTMGSIPVAFRSVASAANCEHSSAERRSIIATEIRDANGDGIDDVVIFSGMLSAHVFLGSLKDGRLSFGRELDSGRDLPIADLRLWFPYKMEAGKGERPFATKARSQLANIGWQLQPQRRMDALFTLHTERRRGWLLNYYAAGDAVVPVMDYRSHWPHKQDQNPMVEHYRQSLVLDADHDRSPDILSVHVGSEFKWLRPTPKPRDEIPMGHRQELNGGRLRCGIVHGLGERHDEANRVLVQFDDEIKLPKNPGEGYPISVAKVPVYGRAGNRVRYCVLFRARRLGLFFEVAPVTPEVARVRQAAAWARRAERRLEMQPYYLACDQGVCEHDEPHHSEVFDDAIALFKRGLELAENARDKAVIWRNVARVHGRAGQIKRARRAYERFVMLARVIEPLAAPHPDLVALFADEEFRALHAGWAKKLPTARAGAF